MNRFVLIFVFFVLSSMFGFAQTSGDLSISVLTSKAGGEYAPRHVMAVWVEDGSGNFVKTLLAYAEKRKSDLSNWKKVTAAAGSQYNSVDAVTSATKNSHDTRICSWNGTDFNKQIVADGKYKICMELADGSRNYSTFDVTKGTGSESLSPSNVTSFSNINLVWTPLVNTAVRNIDNSSDFLLYPNFTTGLVDVKGPAIEKIRVVNSSGQQVLSTTSTSFDLSAYPKGLYFVKITSNNKTFVRKLIKE